MALTPFQSRVRATVTQVRAPQQSSGIGEAFTVLGRTAGQISDNNAQTEERVKAVDHQIAMRERQRADDDLAVAVAKRQAEAAQELRVFDEENQTSADYEKLKTAEVDKKVSEIRGMIGANDRVGQRFEVPLTTFAQSEKADAIIYATRVRNKAVGEAYQATADTLANIAYSDPLKAEPGITALTESIMGGTVIDDALKPAALRKVLEPIRVAQINGAIDKGNLEAIKAELKAGTFDAVIGPERKNQFMDRIEVEERAIVVAQEAAASDARKDARAGIEALVEQTKLGIMPTQAEFAAARARGQAAGLEAADMIALDGLGLQTALNRQFGPAVDPMGIKAASVAAQLGPKIAAGTASKDEQATYAHLRGVAESSAKSFGASLKELAGQSIAGQIQVLDQLRVMPAEQRYAAANEAKPGLGMVSMLGKKSQKYALDGQEVRNARPKDFGEDKEVQAAFKRRVGDVGAMMGGQYDDTFNTAWNIYAGALNAKSRSGWDQAEFDTAVKLATGATLRGDGAMQGGIGRVRGYQVQLPDWKTPAEFDITLSSLKFAGAIYKDGRAASKADILANYRPEYYADDAEGNPRYRFIDARGNPLGHKDGIFDIVVQR